MEYNFDPVKYLICMVEEIKKDIIDLKTKMDLRAYTLREIAEGQQVSINTMRTKPWKMPNYGKPDVGSCPKKWYYKTIVDWYAVPEDERKFKWESMTSKGRQQAMGETA